MNEEQVREAIASALKEERRRVAEVMKLWLGAVAPWLSIRHREVLRLLIRDVENRELVDGRLAHAIDCDMGDDCTCGVGG